MNVHDIDEANSILLKGGVIAYPTEAVFGLGCDPFNQKAVETIYRLKKRDPTKALLLIASSWDQIKNLVGKIPAKKLQIVMDTWPGPVTWVFPTSQHSPKFILGEESSIAVRVTDHPIAKAICEAFGPIVSTSANPEGSPPATSTEEVQRYFPDQIDYIVKGEVGSHPKPTTIRDALTGEIIRY